MIVAAVIAPAGSVLASSMARSLPTRRSGLPLGMAGVAMFGLVLAIGELVSMATGSLTVIVPAVAQAVESRGLSGPVLAALALGEAVGALLFGARPLPGSRRSHLVTGLALTASGYAVLPLVADQLMLVAGLVFIAGALSSPVAILLSAALDDVVQPEMLASAYGLVVVAAAGLIVGSPAGIAGAAATSATMVAVAAALAVPRIERRPTTH